MSASEEDSLPKGIGDGSLCFWSVRLLDVSEEDSLPKGIGDKRSLLAFPG